MKTVRSLVFKAILLALCLVFSYVEALVPQIVPIPGFKLGLSNIVILFTMYTFGGAAAFVIGLLKVLIMFLLFGNLTSFILSLCGFLLSISFMLIIRKIGAFSVAGVSMAGGIFHNIGQLAGASLYLGQLRIWDLLPVLSLVGCITGILMGLLAGIIIERLKLYDRIYKRDT